MYEAATATVDPEKLFENAIRYFQWYFFFWTYNFKHSKQCLPFLSPEMQVKLLKVYPQKTLSCLDYPNLIKMYSEAVPLPGYSLPIISYFEPTFSFQKCIMVATIRYRLGQYAIISKPVWQVSLFHYILFIMKDIP